MDPSSEVAPFVLRPLPGLRGAVGRGGLRRSAPRAPLGLRARRRSRAGTGGPVWRRVRPERWVGRASATPRLTMKRRAPGCMEGEQDQEAALAARQ